MSKNHRIIIPGAAGLVGQNLIVLLKQYGYQDIIALDKHPANTRILKELHPDITIIETDIARNNDWQQYVNDNSIIVMLQAQIGSKDPEPFYANNITSTEKMLECAKQNSVPFIVHVSSSVVESVADDDYTNTKKQQEDLIKQSGIDFCILRPTLMFGWFDRKHLGWLSRFMKKSPVFPVPGHGRYMRQPLYAKDFCKIIISCIEKQPKGQAYNITGRDNVDYIDIIKSIKHSVKSRTWVMKIPYSVFWILLKVYSLFDRDPPFTVSQLKALTAGDEFELIEWWDIFDVQATSFEDAIHETFNDKIYSKIILDF